MTDSPAPAPAPSPLRVLHLDEAFVAVSKPSGLLTHRDEHHPDAPAALQVVRDQVGRFLYPVHRLDRATSGILLYAFTSADSAALQAAMGGASANKEYLALVRWPGRYPELGDTWSCERPLHDNRDIERAARTDFALVEAFRRCALVRCRLFTGRYHQIRRHCNHCGRHVLGDTTHGKGRLNQLYRERYGLDRLFLHACRLVLPHPRTGSQLTFDDPLPGDLEAVLERLRTEAANPAEPSDPAPVS